MWFLLRTAFWFSLILVLLPSRGPDPATNAQVSASEAISAARAAVIDMRQFCDRQPGACVIGSSAATKIGHRAQAGAKMIYDFLTEQLGPDETGSVSSNRNSDPLGGAPPSSRDTLTKSDLAPLWRGPQPPREGHQPPI